MRSALITGASSRIGVALAQRLQADHRLLLLRHRRPVPTAGIEAEVLEGGLEGLRDHAGRVREADLVLHLAAQTHSRRESDYFRVNLDGMRRLLDIVRPDQPVVFLSTRCVGAEGGGYSHSKMLAEQALEASGRPHAVVRPAEVYGTRSGEGIDTLLRWASRWRLLVDFRWQGSVTYSPIAVEELADFLAALARSGTFRGQVYTLTNDAEFGAREIHRALQRGLRKRIFRLPVPVGALHRAQRLGLPLPFAVDQLARLVMRKSSDDGCARRDFGFSPRAFLDWLENDYPGAE